MLRLYSLLLFISLHSLYAFTNNAITKVEKQESKEVITFNTSLEVQQGVSGYIVHHIDSNHQVIIATIIVDSYNKELDNATAEVKKFNFLEQDALPKTTYSTQVGDEVVVATEYSRALLIAPSESLYYHLTRAINNLEWIHPDKFAVFLSYRGHPSPQKKDFQDFCEAASVGLVYIYAKNNLYTLDCRSFIPLQVTPAIFSNENEQTPFYSRVEKIDKSWWGLTLFDSGNEDIKNYDEYYLQLMKVKDKNSTNQLKS